jgi:hypothetical protein
MYKNFNLTDEERKEIMEMHKSHGYKKPLNELDDKDVDLVRGNPDFKTQTGRPVGDYVIKRAAANQFQQDFKKEFPDPGVETTPYWMKDRPNSDGDSELELDIRNSARQANRELGKKLEKDTISQDREERIKLRRRIASLVSHRDEFGGDDELDILIRRLRDQAMDMDDSRQPSVTSDEIPNLNENDSSNSIKVLWEKISEISKNYSDALRNLDAVGCDDSETYAEYYHSSGQMEPGDHDDRDDYEDREDNGYSHSQQSFADRLDYANSAEDPITRAERRMGA